MDADTRADLDALKRRLASVNGETALPPPAPPALMEVMVVCIDCKESIPKDALYMYHTDGALCKTCFNDRYEPVEDDGEDDDTDPEDEPLSDEPLSLEDVLAPLTFTPVSATPTPRTPVVRQLTIPAENIVTDEKELERKRMKIIVTNRKMLG